MIVKEETVEVVEEKYESPKEEKIDLPLHPYVQKDPIETYYEEKKISYENPVYNQSSDKPSPQKLQNSLVEEARLRKESRTSKPDLKSSSSCSKCIIN